MGAALHTGNTHTNTHVRRHKPHCHLVSFVVLILYRTGVWYVIQTTGHSRVNSHMLAPARKGKGCPRVSMCVGGCMSRTG